MRTLALVVLLASLSSPAMAETLTVAQRDCPVTKVGADFRSRLTDVMTETSASDAEREEMLKVMMVIAAVCHNKHGLPMESRGRTARFAIIRLVAEEMANRMDREGVPAHLINEALDIGPDRTNVPREGIEESEVRHLYKVFGHEGIKLDDHPRALDMLGTYVGTTVRYYRELASLD